MATIPGFGPIPWDALATFSGSAATLIAGFAAVIAAYKVGKRQLEIANRQTEILQRQSETDTMRLRAELYERRISTYNQIVRFVDLFEVDESMIFKDDSNAYFDAASEADFLFSEKLKSHLHEHSNFIREAISVRNKYISYTIAKWDVPPLDELAYAEVKKRMLKFRVILRHYAAIDITIGGDPDARISN